MNSNLPSQSEAQWAERDNRSFRGALNRIDNPWKLVIPPVMPEPAIDGQVLHWGQNLCGLWSYRRYLAINGKWVDLEPRKVYAHPMSGREFDPHES